MGNYLRSDVITIITTPTTSCVADLDKLNLIIEIISPIPASRVNKNTINLLFVTSQ